MHNPLSKLRQMRQSCSPSSNGRLEVCIEVVCTSKCAGEGTKRSRVTDGGTRLDKLPCENNDPVVRFGVAERWCDNVWSGGENEAGVYERKRGREIERCGLLTDG